MSHIAEEGVIGSICLDSDCIADIAGSLKPEMFTDKLYSAIYKEWLEAYINNYKIDIVEIAHNLQGQFQENEILNAIKICSLSISTSAQVESLAKVVINDYKAFKLNEYLQSHTITGANIDVYIKHLQLEIEGLEDATESKAKSLTDIAKENKERYFKPKEKIITTGFDNVDDWLCGLEGGDVIVIGARPAVGKSAFALQVVRNMANKGLKVGLFNLEMSEQQIYERFVVAESGIELMRLRRAIAFLGDEKENFDSANEAVEKYENIFISTGSKSPSDIRKESRKVGYDVIVIDYLQLLKNETNYRGNRAAEVGAISKAIKQIATDFNIPVIILSQLNRLSQRYQEPSMSELRESGDIEQDASVIMLLWNLNKDDGEKKGLKVEKNRQGVLGKETLIFDGAHMTFTETNENPRDVQNQYSDWSSVNEPTPFD